jgi:PBP1b-binding outer membrane lipoprotein LpoB
MRLLFIAVAALLVSCRSGKNVSDNKDNAFKNFNYPEVNFINKAEGTKG